MFGVGGYDQVKRALQDLIAPEIKALRGDIRVINERLVALDVKIDGVDSRLTGKIDAVETRLVEKIDGLDSRLSGKIDSLRAEMTSELRRVDTRIDGLDARIDGLGRELHVAIDVRERLAALEARRSS